MACAASIPDRDVEVRLIEAAPSVLPALPERLQVATERQLQALGVEVRTAEQVERVTAEGVHTRSGQLIPADLIVWTAGVKGAAWLAELDGLEVDRSNQLVVDPTLRTSRDEHIFALGDCAACRLPGAERPVPPRAQAAFQQAQLLARSLTRRLDGREPLPFVYRDYGSLISLSSSHARQPDGQAAQERHDRGPDRAPGLSVAVQEASAGACMGSRWVTLAALANLAAPARPAASQAALSGPAAGKDRRMAKEHHFAAHLVWTGAAAGPTRTYEGYDRAWRAEVAGKPPLEGSADPVFRGDPARYNPEDLLVVALSACHMLTYLALCARAGIEVSAYEDQASGTMAIKDGKLRFVEVTLAPRVVIARRRPRAGTGAARAGARRLLHRQLGQFSGAQPADGVGAGS